MKKHLALLVVTSSLFLQAYAGTEKLWDGTYTPYKGRYLSYSNDLDEK
ncbi:hypothetical protein HSX11_27370 [Oxalobacteraceae bacterium]|nr:hypothetical protein [Oxalobacteraceae bacterium]